MEVVPLTQLLWQQTQMAAQLARLDARLFTVQEPGELSAAFETMVQDGANGVVVLSNSVFNKRAADNHRARDKASPAGSIRGS